MDRDSKGMFIKNHKSFVKKGINKGKRNSIATEFKKGQNPWNKTNIIINCSFCKNKIKIPQWRIEKTKNICCSMDCRNKLKIGKNVSKETRIKISLKNKGKKRSQKHIESISGKNSSWWKGGISKGYKTGYYSAKYKQWRKLVFERDNYICQKCFGKRGQYITAHHIKSWAKYPKLRFDLNNGLTLCEKCHSETDNYKGKNKGKQKI